MKGVYDPRGSARTFLGKASSFCFQSLKLQVAKRADRRIACHREVSPQISHKRILLESDFCISHSCLDTFSDCAGKVKGGWVSSSPVQVLQSRNVVEKIKSHQKIG